jgi:hypothetical protein
MQGWLHPMSISGWSFLLSYSSDLVGLQMEKKYFWLFHVEFKLQAVQLKVN